MDGARSWETLDASSWKQTLWTGGEDHCARVFLQGGFQEYLFGLVIMILENTYGLTDDPQHWWKKSNVVMTSIWLARSTFDVCVCSRKLC